MKIKNKTVIFSACIVWTLALVVSYNLVKVKTPLKTEIQNPKIIVDKKIPSSTIENGYWSNKNIDTPVWIEKEPLEALFDKKLNDYLNKEFRIISPESEEAKTSKMVQSKSFWIGNYLFNNEVWYKSEYLDEYSDSKMTLFFNFYNCKAVNPKTKQFIRCFKIFIYNFRNDNWYVSNSVARQENIRWRNNTAYIEVSLQVLEDYSRLTGSLYILIPVPRDSMPIYYLKYEDHKFSLVKGPDSDWVLIGESDFVKFQKWTEGYKVKHGETPEQ